jgi:hypothetical protein
MDCDRKSGSLTKRIVLAVALLMSFHTFQFFPGMSYVQEFWFVLCFLALIVVYPAWKISKGLRFSVLELYILVLILVAALLPAWAAQREFGQPVVLGLLAHRGATLMVSSLLVLNAMRYRLVRPAEIEGALLLTAWGTFFLYTVMRLALNPANFVSYGLAFVSGTGAQAVLVLPQQFIVFALIYYALLGFRTRRKKYYVLAAILFVSTIVPTVERSMTISLAVTLLFFLHRWRPFGQFLLTLGKVLCAAAIILGLTYVVNPAYLSKQSAKFVDAFKVAFTGSTVDDPSAGVRVFETVTALSYIQKHPLVGNGELSHQWQGGNEGALGAYFYPGDVGVIGAVFVFGLFGILIFAYQYRFALRSSRSLPERIRGPLSDAAAGFLLYSAVISLAQAPFVLAPEMTLMFVVILSGLAFEGTSEHRSSFQCCPTIPALSLANGVPALRAGLNDGAK